MGEKNGAKKTAVAIKKEPEQPSNLLPATNNPALKYFSMIPTNVTEALQLSKMIADSDLAPKDYKGKPANVLIAMQMGAEVGLGPMQAIQNIAVINGKPGVYGDVGKALLLSKGFRIEERDVKEVQAKNEAWCKITRPDGQVTERTFSKDHAIAANLWGNNTWKTYPWRMMAWRAFWWAARDAGADVLKGIGGIEELQDIRKDAIEAESAHLAPKEIETRETLPESQAPEPTPETPVVDAGPMITPDQRTALIDLMNKHKVTPDQLKAYLNEKLGITDTVKPTALIPQSKYQVVCAWIIDAQDQIGL